MTVYVAPALPTAKPEALRGLTHLHGKLGSSKSDRELVLTMADFGIAYMLEGWARRFVIDLFRHYHVVFIGYRVEDPTMRYLVSALAAARAKKVSNSKSLMLLRLTGKKTAILTRRKRPNRNGNSKD